VLTYRSKISVTEVNGVNRMGVVTKQTQRVVDLLEVPIPQRLGLQGEVCLPCGNA